MAFFLMERERKSFAQRSKKKRKRNRKMVLEREREKKRWRGQNQHAWIELRGQTESVSKENLREFEAYGLQIS